MSNATCDPAIGLVLIGMIGLGYVVGFVQGLWGGRR